MSGPKQARGVSGPPRRVRRGVYLVALDKANFDSSSTGMLGSATLRGQRPPWPILRARPVMPTTVTSSTVSCQHVAAVRSLGDGRLRHRSVGDPRLAPEEDRSLPVRARARRTSSRRLTVHGAPGPQRDASTARHRNGQYATMEGKIGRASLGLRLRSAASVNHAAACALNYAWYNLGCIVRTLRVTPAMAAGVTGPACEPGEFSNAITG